jgi:homoserine dehydrogenase
MATPLRIGIAGLGTVGGGTLKILAAQAAMVEERCGRKIVIAGVSARDKNKKRYLDIGNYRWFDDPMAMVADKDIDVIVETIGGAEGAARKLVEAALIHGKSVVTANKALIAEHGVALATLAEKNNVMLAFEAAVAGGIPIIKTLREGLAANQVSRIAGILNGTCNYILTTMWSAKCSFQTALEEAQAKGYAEADPSFDIEGTDTAHKLAILSSLAFGMAPVTDMHIGGIKRMTLRDMEFAAELGYVVKLLGIAEETQTGISQRVHPCMVPKTSALATVPGATNAILVDGNAVGNVFLEGQGAGAGPTASAIVADLMDIARGAKYKPFTLPAASLKKRPLAAMDALVSSYYLRLNVIDRPGVLADVTGLLRDESISLRSFIQHSHKPGEPVQVVFTTHETSEAHMQKAIANIGALESVKEKPYMIRIENL